MIPVQASPTSYRLKHSYLEQTSKVLYDYINNDGEGLPFNFTDAYGKVVIRERKWFKS